MALPNGLDEIITLYGNPFPMAAAPAEWEKRFITTIAVPHKLLVYLGNNVLIIRAHMKLQTVLRQTFVDMVRAGIESVPFGKAYAWEIVGEELGVHSWGIAIHLGAEDGPGENVAGVMLNHGFVISDTDPRHFQLATGYWVE